MLTEADYQEVDNYDKEALYWRHRIMTGEIGDVTAERSRYERTRLEGRKPESPRADSPASIEIEGPGPSDSDPGVSEGPT